MQGLVLTALLLLLFVLPGCAPLPRQMEPPQVSIANLRLVNATLFEQRYELSLRVRNFNRFAIPLEGVQYAVEINGQPFFTGLSSREIEIPGLETVLLDLEATSSLLQMLRQLKTMERRDSVTYRLVGRFYLPGERSLAFAHEDELRLEELGELLLPEEQPGTGMGEEMQPR